MNAKDADRKLAVALARVRAAEDALSRAYQVAQRANDAYNVAARHARRVPPEEGWNP